MTDAPGDALHYREICELVDLLDRGEVTSRQLTEATLDRIATVDQRLGAYAFVAPGEALAQAAESDERRKADATRGPLDGIPLAVKDIYDKRGWRTEAGMAVRSGQVATSTATVVERLDAAGAVIVGKVHTTEGVYTEHTPRSALRSIPGTRTAGSVCRPVAAAWPPWPDYVMAHWVPIPAGRYACRRPPTGPPA